MKSLTYEAVNTYVVMHTVFEMYVCVYSNKCNNSNMYE